MRTSFLLPLLLLTAAACECECDCDDCCGYYYYDTLSPHPVSIQVQVYDPTTDFVWDNVGVRIVEADQEWSNTTCESLAADWILTDRDGRVCFDGHALAAAGVGFAEDQGAVIFPDHLQDEATVWLEVSAEGFTPVLVEVPISWSNPDAFVAVPFN